MILFLDFFLGGMTLKVIFFSGSRVFMLCFLFSLRLSRPLKNEVAAEVAQEAIPA